MTIRPFLLAIMMCGATIRGAGDTLPSVVTDVRYDVLNEKSRLTMHVSGPIRYSVQGRGPVVSLRFVKTGIASPPGDGRKTFGSGDIAALAVRRLPGDSLLLEVVLRDTDRYVLAQPSAGGVLVMEIPAASPRRSAPPAGPKTKDRAEAGRASDVPSGSPLDIPAVIRSQITGSGEKDLHPTNAAPAPVRPGGPDAPRSYGLVLAVIACLVAGATTVLSLILMRRFLPPRRERLPDVQRPPAIGHRAGEYSPDFRNPHQDREEDQRFESVEEETIPEEPGTMEPLDAVAELAERFRRGYDEVGLAVRLHGTKPAPVSADVMVKAAGNGGRAARMNAARKLGVGHGEVNLALHLKEFEHRNGGGQR